MNLTVRTATRLVAANVLSAVGQDSISRAMLARYAAPVAAVIRAEAPAPLIPMLVASSRIGLLDFSVLGESDIAEKEHQHLLDSITMSAPRPE